MAEEREPTIAVVVRTEPKKDPTFTKSLLDMRRKARMAECQVHVIADHGAPIPNDLTMTMLSPIAVHYPPAMGRSVGDKVFCMWWALHMLQSDDSDIFVICADDAQWHPNTRQGIKNAIARSNDNFVMMADMIVMTRACLSKCAEFASQIAHGVPQAMLTKSPHPLTPPAGAKDATERPH